MPAEVESEGNCKGDAFASTFDVALGDIFDHLQDRNLALYEEILKEARSRFEPGERLR